MSVTEPSYAINVGMVIRIEGRRLALRASLRPQIFGWLVGWLVTGFLLDSWSLKMGRIGCPETSVRNYHYSLRNNLEERILIYFAAEAVNYACCKLTF